MARSLLLLAVVLAVMALPAGAVRVEGTVTDAGTGQPVACRIYVEGPPGEFHLVEAEGAATYDKQRGESVEVHTAIPDGRFSADLPPGEYKLIAERGKEYLPASHTLLLGGEAASVKLSLRRWIDMAGRGWYSGDTHVHRSLDELPTVVMAEDLNFSYPLLYWVTRAFEPPGQGDRSTAKDPPATEIEVDATHRIWPRNTEYEIFTVDGESHTLGAFFLIGHKGVFEKGVPPVVPVGQQARREGALIELDKHAWPWSMALVPLLNVDLYELANNHMWRTEFGFSEWGEPAAPYMNIERTESGWTEWGWIDYGFQTYYALLNSGFRLRPTAGTASGVHPVPLGYGRVYVQLEGPPSSERWLDALNKGRSFVTTGPMLFVEADGRAPGEHVEAGMPTGVLVEIDAISEEPLDRIELVRNGQVVRTLAPANEPTGRGAYRSRTAVGVHFPESGWFVVRAIEKRPGGRIRFAHSSPTFVDVADKPLRPSRREVEYLMDRVRSQIVRSRDVLPKEAIAEYEKALAVYTEILETAKP